MGDLGKKSVFSSGNDFCRFLVDCTKLTLIKSDSGISGRIGHYKKRANSSPAACLGAFNQREIWQCIAGT